MLLSDRDLVAAIKSGNLRVEPFDSGLVQPASVDVRLGHTFRIFDNYQAASIDPRNPGDMTTVVTVPPRSPFVLHPGEFALGSTLEKVTLDATLAARLDGKSSLGRLGLLTHSTAGFIDPGFGGHVTLELANVARLPILLWPGMPIGQLCVLPLSSPAERPYGSAGLGSRYQGQVGPTASRGVTQNPRGDFDV
jgi:dCTP deaminase